MLIIMCFGPVKGVGLVPLPWRGDTPRHWQLAFISSRTDAVVQGGLHPLGLSAVVCFLEHHLPDP